MNGNAMHLTPLLTGKLAAAAALAALTLLDVAARGLAALQDGVGVTAGGSVRIETVIIITSTVVGLATAYLRLYVGSEVGKLKDSLTLMIQSEIGKLRTELVTKEVHGLEYRQLERRLEAVEKEKGEGR